MFWRKEESSLLAKSCGSSAPPTIAETYRETIGNYLAKQSKVDLAESAAHMDDLRKLQEADREKVRRYEELKVFGNKTPPAKPVSQGEDVGKIIICDDYHVDNSAVPKDASKSNRTPLAIAVAAAALAGYSLMPSDPTPAEPQAPPASTTVDDSDTRYNLEFVE